MISVVINADTRIGYLNDKSQVGDYGSGSLQGVRSVELLTAGLKNKMDFFKGYDCQCIMYIDRHEPLSHELIQELRFIINRIGNNSKLIIKGHDRTKYKWNDYLYIEALKLAEGDYICHMDNDTSLYKKDGCEIVKHYLLWLNNQYKYVCQPWDRTGDEMYWASTRFFMCKKETLDLQNIEANMFINPLKGKNNPCFEHTAGILAGEGNVYYPPRDDDNYIIFCWSRYFKGTLEKLNEMSYEEVKNYIVKCGLFGCNDVFDKIPIQ